MDETAASQTVQEAPQKEGENSRPEASIESPEGNQLVNSFLKSKEFLTSELTAVFASAKESIVKEITSSVMEQLNKKLEDNLKLTAETYKRKDEQEEWVEKIIAGAKDMKMTY